MPFYVYIFIYIHMVLQAQVFLQVFSPRIVWPRNFDPVGTTELLSCLPLDRLFARPSRKPLRSGGEGFFGSRCGGSFFFLVLGR